MTDIDYSGPLRRESSPPPPDWGVPFGGSPLPPRSIWWPFVIVAIGVALSVGGFLAGRASAAELPAERPWVVWLVDADKPWTSAKGYQATATGPTACSLALHEVTKASPTGTKLACRRVAK